MSAATELVAVPTLQSDHDTAGLVRHVRVQLSLTQREFARLIGADSTQVSQWENNHIRPSRYRQHLISAAADAVERGGVFRVAESLAACGPAFAWWRILDKAYAPDEL